MPVLPEIALVVSVIGRSCFRFCQFFQGSFTVVWINNVYKLLLERYESTSFISNVLRHIFLEVQ